MKQLYTTLVALFVIVQSSSGQWTNNTNINNTNIGNVGIGTTNPGYKLEVADASGSSQNNIAVFTNKTNNSYTSLTAAGSSSIPTWINSNILEFVPYSSGNGVISSYTGSLLFQTNDRNNRMAISQNGNIGIGTTNPASMLHVAGTIVSSSSTGIPTSVPIITMQYNNSLDQGELLSLNQGVDWKPLVLSARNFSVISYGNKQGLYQNNIGFVGVGTTTPATLFDVDGGINKGKIKIDGTGALAQLKFYRWSGSGALYNSSAIVTDQNSTGGTIIKFQTASGAASTPGLETLNTQMVIDGSGNVGIGTTTPREALSVNGRIRSQEVKVETANWPDYVFDAKYMLPSLLEVKKYIDLNHHLPDVPSEQEIKENGLNLGEINKILTKKVEELTLYAIQQKEELQKITQAQQQQIDELKAQISKLIRQ